MPEVEYMRLENDILDIEGPAAARKANITGGNGYTGLFTIRKQIGESNYEVSAYFSQKSGESLEDKILRLALNDGLNLEANR
jgi:N-acetyl-gamma-glutamylphosphate reductase